MGRSVRCLWLLLSTVPVLAVGPAISADLPTRKEPSAAPVMSQNYNWTGFYLGANVGGAWHNADWFEDLTSGGSAGASAPGFHDGSTKSSGVIGGVQGGADYQFNSLVIGVNADADLSGVSGDSGCFQQIGGTTQSCRTEQNLFGTVTGRLGFAFDRALFYGLGGFAWEHEKLENPCAGLCGGYASTNNVFTGDRAGYTVGAGIEYALTRNLSIFGQYNYMDFGKRDLTLVGVPAGSGNFSEDISENEHVVKLGLNWRFGN